MLTIAPHDNDCPQKEELDATECLCHGQAWNRYVFTFVPPGGLHVRVPGMPPGTIGLWVVAYAESLGEAWERVDAAYCPSRVDYRPDQNDNDRPGWTWTGYTGPTNRFGPRFWSHGLVFPILIGNAF